MVGLFIVAALLIVALVAFIVLAMLASSYYLGPYARSTKHYFLHTLRSPHALLQHRLGAAITDAYNKGCVWALFDVRMPHDDTDSILADCVAVASDGIHVFSVVSGRISVAGDAEGETWLIQPKKSVEDDTSLMDNRWIHAKTVAQAVVSYLGLDASRAAAVFPHVVLGKHVDATNLSVDEDTAILALRDVRKMLESRSQGDVVFDSDTRKQLARMLRAAVQVDTIDPDGEGIKALAERTGEKVLSAVRGGRDEAVDADILRRADKIATMKQDFDGVSWDRIIELGDRMMLEDDADARADYNAEIRLIARANLSLSYRLGIPLGPTSVENESGSATNPLAIGSNEERGWTRSIVNEALDDSPSEDTLPELGESDFLKEPVREFSLDPRADVEDQQS